MGAKYLQVMIMTGGVVEKITFIFQAHKLKIVLNYQFDKFSRRWRFDLRCPTHNEQASVNV